MFHSAVTLLIVTLSVQFVESDTCGRHTADGLDLVNKGNRSRLGEWPWHADVYYRIERLNETISMYKYACGATILSRNYVITTARCTLTGDLRDMSVHFGLYKNTSSYLNSGVECIERHEDYNKTTSENDIALLRLEKYLEFTDYVKPICLWMRDDDEAVIVTKHGYVTGYDEILMTNVEMPFVSGKNCRAKNDDDYTPYLFDGKAFCAGYENGSYVYLANSGDGLYVEIDGEWQLRGIASNGKVDPIYGWLVSNSYILFTNVAHFRPWIQSIMEPMLGSNTDYAVCGKKIDLTFQRTGSKEERKWPWQGEVYRNTMRLSEVVIISEYFLLSPADVYSGKDLRVPVNITAFFKNSTGQVLASYTILRVLRHESYTRERRMNNIALLELAEKITLTRLLRPICVWTIESNVQGIEGYTADYIHSLHDYDPSSSQEFVKGTFRFIQESYIIQSDFVYILHNGTWYLRGVILDVVQGKESSYDVIMLDVYRYKDWIRNQLFQDLESKPRNLLEQDCSLMNLKDATYRVKDSRSSTCYSTLIAPTLLITTASCVDQFTEESITVFDWIDSLKPVRKIHLHPHFDNQSLFNNIAIIELNTPVDKLPLCLPTFSENLSNFHFIMPTYYWLVNIIITDVETCGNRWRGRHICAKMQEYQWYRLKAVFHFACDTQLQGLPLAYRVGYKYFMRGISDIALENRCYQNSPSEVFVDIMLYADWIRETYSKCSSCPKVPVLDDEDGEPMEDWRNVDPRNHAG